MPFNQNNVPIDHSFVGQGFVSCQVVSGNVKIKVNATDVGEYGGTPQAKSNLYTTKKTSNDNWRVEVTAISGVIEVIFNSP